MGLGATTAPERLIKPRRFGETYVTARQPQTRGRPWRLATTSASRLCAWVWIRLNCRAEFP